MIEIKKVKLWFPGEEPISVEIGARFPHATHHTGNGATVQKMELDPTGGLLLFLAGGRMCYINDVPRVMDLVESGK